MGPIALLDKSALQGLSKREIFCLTSHYYLNIPPVLVLEVLGDHAKPEAEQGISRSQAQDLAKKLSPPQTKVCTHYKTMVWGELQGNKIPMDDRRIPILGAKTFRDATGEVGVFIDQSPEEKAILRWYFGKFKEAEKLLSERYREAIGNLNLEKFQSDLKPIFSSLPRVKTFEELARCVSEIVSQPEDDSSIVALLMKELRFTAHFQFKTLERWKKSGAKKLVEFAPYSDYCFKVMMGFHLGLAHHLIGPRPTNRIDMEYLFYLPFCQIFSSSDRFQSAYAKALLKDDQLFIDGAEFKSDLKGIAEFLDAMPEEDRRKWNEEFGSYAPENPKSFTHQAHKKFLRPRQPGAGNRLSKMTEAEKAKVIKDLQPKLDAIRRIEEMERKRPKEDDLGKLWGGTEPPAKS